jgi:hypothetical protein
MLAKCSLDCDGQFCGDTAYWSIRLYLVLPEKPCVKVHNSFDTVATTC